MKNLDQYIQEKYLIDIDTTGTIDNKIDISCLKYFTKQDVKDIINWACGMPIDIQPCIITNNLELEENNLVNDKFKEYEIYFLYDENYKKYKISLQPWIRFWKDDEGVNVDIYDYYSYKWIKSEINKDIKKCFKFLEKNYNKIKIIINHWNETDK